MENSGRTLVCSVLFLDIVEYTKKPVSDQLQIKQEFNRVLTKALEQVPPRDRIILDTGDGAAVTFMGDPEDALFASMAVRAVATRFFATFRSSSDAAGADWSADASSDAASSSSRSRIASSWHTSRRLSIGSRTIWIIQGATCN